MRVALAIFLGLLAGAAYAHPAPNSTLRLEFRADAVHAEYWVPVSELAFARAADPAGEEFAAYLLRHFEWSRTGGRVRMRMGATLEPKPGVVVKLRRREGLTT